MKVDKRKLESRVRRKAEKAPCNYRVVAVGIDARGRVIGISTNIFRDELKARDANKWRITHHAEERLIHSCPKSLRTIYIARFGRKGIARPIDPCEHCSKLAKKRGVVIKRMHEDV